MGKTEKKDLLKFLTPFDKDLKEQKIKISPMSSVK